MDVSKKYYAKVLLAGEYTVFLGGEAISVPLRSFAATIKNINIDSESHNNSISSLKSLYTYLLSLPEKSFNASPKLSKLNDFLINNYYIDSNIPIGYGIGSSAAVSALVYDQFFEEQSILSLQQKKDDLATIESHFHGKSSGVDALSSYTNKALHFSSKGPEIISQIDPLKPKHGYHFFLLNTHTTYKTAPLVKYFKDKMKEAEFSKIANDLLLLNNKLISSLLSKNRDDPRLLFKDISELQWKHFQEMIPNTIQDIWLKGLESNTFHLKLNGSGGGFALGIAHETAIKAVEEQCSSFDPIWL